MSGQRSPGRSRPLIALAALILLLLGGYLGRALHDHGDHDLPTPRPTVSVSPT